MKAPYALLVLAIGLSPATWANCPETPNLGNLNPTGANLRALACTLNALAPSATGERADAIAHLRGLGDAGARNRLIAQLLPELALIEQRRDPLRGTPPTVRTRSTTPKASAGQTTLVWHSSAPDSNRSIWLQALARSSKQGRDDDVEGFDADDRGVAVGFDWQATESTALGVSFSYSRGEADSSRLGSDETSSQDITLYAGREIGAHTLSAFLTAGESDADRERLLELAGRRITFESNIEGRYIGGGVGWSRLFDVSAHWSVDPFASISYLRVANEDYVERGGGTLNLAVSTDDQSLTSAAVGATLSRTAFAGSWLVSTEITTTVETQINDDRTRSTVRFRGTDRRFLSTGHTRSSVGWRLGAGVQLMHWNGLSLGVHAEYGRTDQYSDRAVIMSIQSLF